MNNTYSLKYEIILVAYLFTQENIEFVKKNYPHVNLIVSNEIRGFSENNNLALKQAKGKYCFVLNDDTSFSTPVIDNLFRTLEQLPDDVAVVSPKILNSDGTVQWNGRPKYNCLTYLLYQIKIAGFYERLSKYTNKEGVYQSYNIVGACFMIRRQVFKELGWFNEYYFFSPEDIAFSRLLNENGYKCYVNTDIEIVHYGGATSTLSEIQVATKPAAIKGLIEFYSNGSKFSYIYISLITYASNLVKKILFTMIYLITKNEKYKLKKEIMNNNLKVIFSKLSPKEIFIKFKP